MFRELTLAGGERSIQTEHAEGELREAAVAGLRAWTQTLPFAVEPKY